MVVVVKHGVGEGLRHVPDLLGLGHKVEDTMLNKLQDVGRAVRTVQVHITLFLTDKGLVALRIEQFPCPDEVLHDIDV